MGTALGVGAVLGSLLMAWGGAMHHAGQLMLWGTLGWFGCLFVFACTPAYPLALGVLVLMGIAQTLALTNMTVLLLSTTTSAMRGRIMGLRALDVAPLFLGGILAGAATSRVGAPLTTLGWFGLLGVFACTPAYPMALGVLVLMGIAQTVALTNMTVLLLSTTTSTMRGRIMGLRALAVAPLFLGGLLAGAATSRVGAPLTTLGCAVLGLLLTAGIAPWVPRRVTP